MRNTSSLLGDDSHGGSSSSLDTIGPPINHENPQRLQRIGDDSSLGGSSSSLDTIVPPINHENPQHSPYRHLTNASSFLGGPSFLGRILSPIRGSSRNPENPYPSSTVLHSNGDLGNASFIASPSDDSLPSLSTTSTDDSQANTIPFEPHTAATHSPLFSLGLILRTTMIRTSYNYTASLCLLYSDLSLVS
jgi:hypothetical protein